MAETLPEAQRQFTTSISSQEFEILPPLACAWTQEQKHLILERGTKLIEGQMADARRVGVSYPERVRLLKVKRIQLPENHALREAASVIGLLSPDTSRAGPDNSLEVLVIHARWSIVWRDVDRRFHLRLQ